MLFKSVYYYRQSDDATTDYIIKRDTVWETIHFCIFEKV